MALFCVLLAITLRLSHKDYSGGSRNDNTSETTSAPSCLFDLMLKGNELLVVSSIGVISAHLLGLVLFIIVVVIAATAVRWGGNEARGQL